MRGRYYGNKDIDYDGCIRLLCAIGEVRSKRYRIAYQWYLEFQKEVKLQEFLYAANPSCYGRSYEAAIRKRNDALARLRAAERKLKDDLIRLSDGDIRKIQRQVEEQGPYKYQTEYV